jgi:hypothetical protein
MKAIRAYAETNGGEIMPSTISINQTRGSKIPVVIVPADDDAARERVIQAARALVSVIGKGGMKSEIDALKDALRGIE